MLQSHSTCFHFTVLLLTKLFHIEYLLQVTWRLKHEKDQKISSLSGSQEERQRYSCKLTKLTRGEGKSDEHNDSTLIDDNVNKMLHLAAKLGPTKSFEVSGAAYQMQQELLWFKTRTYMLNHDVDSQHIVNIQNITVLFVLAHYRHHPPTPRATVRNHVSYLNAGTVISVRVLEMVCCGDERDINEYYSRDTRKSDRDMGGEAETSGYSCKWAGHTHIERCQGSDGFRGWRGVSLGYTLGCWGCTKYMEYAQQEILLVNILVHCERQGERGGDEGDSEGDKKSEDEMEYQCIASIRRHCGGREIRGCTDLAETESQDGSVVMSNICDQTGSVSGCDDDDEYGDDSRETRVSHSRAGDLVGGDDKEREHTQQWRGLVHRYSKMVLHTSQTGSQELRYSTLTHRFLKLMVQLFGLCGGYLCIRSYYIVENELGGDSVSAQSDRADSEGLQSTEEK
ncbi:hypothetical protein Tco_0074131 [Tanacetum coccineum]